MKTQPRVLIFETGKLLARLCILFNVFGCTCSSSGGNNEYTDCEWDCADFHRICPAMTNSSYIYELQQEGVAEHLPERDMPQPYDCSNLVYRFLCPLSCEACIPCAKRSLLAVSDEIDTLKQIIADLEKNIEKGEPTSPPGIATPPQTTTMAGTTAAPSLGAPSSTTVPPTTTTTTTTTTTPVPEPVTIPIVTAASSLSYANGVDTWTVDKALDDNPATVFLSSDQKNAWAKFYIPSSIVKIVKILNRKDCCGDRMTGEEVWVCEGDDCQKCGVFPAVGNGELGVMSCGGNDGIQGNYVKVVAPNNFLQIAEIEVLGEAQQKVEQVEIQRAESSEIYSEKFPLKYSFDQDETTFLYAKNPQTGWAKYFIPLASVKVVSLENGPNCCYDRMRGNVVFVCADDTDKSCKQCGAITHAVGKKQWAAIDCGGKEGLPGRVVKVAATNSYLQLTEVKIFADHN